MGVCVNIGHVNLAKPQAPCGAIGLTVLRQIEHLNGVEEIGVGLVLEHPFERQYGIHDHHPQGAHHIDEHRVGESEHELHQHEQGSEDAPGDDLHGIPFDW